MVGGFHGMLLLSAKHSRSLVWWEDTIWKAVRSTIWRPSYPVWSNGRIPPYFCKRPFETTSIRSKSLARKIPWICVARGGNLERRHLGRRHWRIGTDGHIWNLWEKTQRKGSVKANEWWKDKIPIAYGTVKLSGGDQVLRTSTLIRDRPDHFETHRSMMVKPGMISGPFHAIFYLPSSHGTQSQTVRAERRIISYSTEIYRRYQDYRYILRWNAGEEHQWLFEHWWRSRIVRYMGSFHKIHCIEWKTTRWMYMVQEETDKKTNDLQTRHFVTRDLERYVWSVQANKNTKVGYRKTDARQSQKIVCIFVIDPDDGEFKDIMKNARRKLKIPMPAAMLCKLQRETYRETCRVEEHKTK